MWRWWFTQSTHEWICKGFTDYRNNSAGQATQQKQEEEEEEEEEEGEQQQQQQKQQQQQQQKQQSFLTVEYMVFQYPLVWKWVNCSLVFCSESDQL